MVAERGGGVCGGGVRPAILRSVGEFVVSDCRGRGNGGTDDGRWCGGGAS
jgi:hypothetical protein